MSNRNRSHARYGRDTKIDLSPLFSQRMNTEAVETALEEFKNRKRERLFLGKIQNAFLEMHEESEEPDFSDMEGYTLASNFRTEEEEDRELETNFVKSLNFIS